jgi:predicted ATPase
MRYNYNNQSLSDLSSFIYEFEDNIDQIPELEFYGNNLSYLPDWFEELINLKKLNLSYNRFTHIPAVIEKLTNLEELVFSYNNIETIPDWIAKLTKLERLELQYNRIKVLPDALFECRKLNELELSFNRITTVPDAVSNLTKLKWLRLNNNFLALLPQELMTLPVLGTITLYGNFQLEKLVNGVIKLDTNLKAKTFIQAILDRQDNPNLRAQPPHIRRFVSYRALGHNYEPHNYSFRYELNRLLQNPIKGNQRYNWVLMPHEVNNLEELQEKYKGYSTKMPDHKKEIGPLMVILTWNAEDEEVLLANDMLKWAEEEQIPYFVFTLTESSNGLKLLAQRFRDEAVSINNIQDCALEMVKRYEGYRDQQQYGDLAKATDIRYQLILQKLRLQNIAHFEDVSLEFDRNMTCIVGRNGAGKSRLLYAIAVAILADQELSVRTLFRDYDYYVSLLYRILETYTDAVKIFAEKGKIELTYSLELIWNEKNVAKASDTDTKEVEILPTYRIELAYSSIDGKLFIDQVSVVDVGKEQAQMDNPPTSSSDDWADQYLGGPVQPIFYSGTMNLKSLVVTVAQHVDIYNPRLEPKPGEIKPSIDDVKPLMLNDNSLQLERFVQWLINKYNPTHYPYEYGQKHALAVFKLIDKVLYYDTDPSPDDLKLEYVAPYQLNPAEIIIKTPTNPNGIQLEKSSLGIHHQLGWMGHLIRRLSEQHPDDMETLRKRLAVVIEQHTGEDMETLQKRSAEVIEQHIEDYIKTLAKRSAVVIIDEIDQSLHPHWQARMLYDLTQVFPNVQFIVTAHSPLCIAGLNREQVCIIDQKDIKPCPIDLWAQWGDEILAKVQGEGQPTMPTKFMERNVKAELNQAYKELQRLKDAPDSEQIASRQKQLEDTIELLNERLERLYLSNMYVEDVKEDWQFYIESIKKTEKELVSLRDKLKAKLEQSEQPSHSTETR